MKMRIKTILGKIDDFWYTRILKKVLFLSKLGKTSIEGESDSGINFDHMYQNVPNGKNLLGVFIDRVLLNLPSVKATRHRKEIIIKILQNEVANNIVLKRKTRILDIASGPARYLVELLSGYNQDQIEILCIDKDRKSLNFGKILSKGKPIRYTRADVLKSAHLKRLAKKISWLANIVLISGLFEYKNDSFVKRVLNEVHLCLENDGLFIFVSQVDNPSKKLMSKICMTSEGKRWELAYRKPEIFRKWLLDMGFRNVIVSVDRWGMYEFCTCRKHK